MNEPNLHNEKFQITNKFEKKFTFAVIKHRQPPLCCERSNCQGSQPSSFKPRTTNPLTQACLTQRLTGAK